MSTANVTVFEIVVEDVTVQVAGHTIKRQEIFRLVFPDGRPALVLVQAIGADNYPFWTSVPEGRQEEAEKIGPIISAYLKKRE